MRTGLCIVLFFILGGRASSQDFYDTGVIQKIEITFFQSNWDYILDTAKAGSDSYLMAQEVTINGISFDSVGVKYKGNSSYNANRDKNPFHIEMDHFAQRDYKGYKDIKLSNGYNEPSNVREALLYSLLQNYTWAPRANFAQVYVNGAYLGLYTNVESITRTFLEDRFDSKDNTFVFADLGGCNLVYRGTDTTLYYTPYTMKSDYGWTDLMNLTRVMRNSISTVEEVLNVDRALWMHAFNNVTVTLDSYSGNSRHNFYLYEDDNSRFNPIHWDMNGGFGIYSRPVNASAWTVPQLETMTPLLHMSDTAWPMINKLLQVPMYYRMYLAHMRTLINENFSSGSYFATAQNLHSLIDTAVFSDTNQFFTYAQYQANLTTNVTVGTRTFPGIQSFVTNRVTYLGGTPEIQMVPPQINMISLSDSTPARGSSFYVTAGVSGATAVYIGIRNGKHDRFFRYPMFDDGMHGDASAGDGIYGIQLLMDNGAKQYFIYAENSDAGIFSPERAEHEYHLVFPGEESGQLNVLIFPNPSSTYLNITIPEDGSEFGIYDLSGRRMLSTGISSGTSTVSLSLASGTYIYRVIHKSGSSSHGYFNVVNGAE